MAVTIQVSDEAPLASNGDTQIANIPNPGRLMEALRHLDYDPYSAVEDIVDNAIDAGAENIWLSLDEGKDQQITLSVADDGSGMERRILDEALKLGSLTERDERSDLGRYGMGLVTAALSIARRTTVYTRAIDGAVLISITDIDTIQKKNAFVKVLREATPEEVEAFGSFYPGGVAPAHGTVVVLDKCDNIGKIDKGFRSKLRIRLAEVYRYFLVGRKMYLDGEIAPFDPLMLGHAETDKRSDATYEVTLKDAEGNDFVADIRARIAVLPDFPDARAKGLTASRQGFYVMRNMRQIAEGVTLNLFEKHAEYNRIRVELFFSGTLDKYMGVRFTKHNVQPVQAIRDKITAEVVSEIRQIGKQLKSQRVAKAPETTEKAHAEATKTITQKAHLLVKPTAASGANGEVGDEMPAAANGGQPAALGTGKKRLLKDLCTFGFYQGGINGLIFEWDKKGKTVVVNWNTDHPFFEHFLGTKGGDRDVVAGIDYLGYSLAAAVLKMQDDDNRDLLESIMTIVATNMRVLLT